MDKKLCVNENFDIVLQRMGDETEYIPYSPAYTHIGAVQI